MSLFTALFGSKNKSSTAIRVISSQEFKVKIENKKVQLIDVRTPKEYKSTFIKNAKNIDLFSVAFDTEIKKLNKNKAVYVYCRSGSRSRQSANKLAAIGFTEIYDLKGGLLRYN